MNVTVLCIFLYVLTLTFMVLHGIINVYGLAYGSQDTMNFNFFFKCIDKFFFLSTQCAINVCFKSFLSIIDFSIFSYMGAKLPKIPYMAWLPKGLWWVSRDLKMSQSV